MKEKLQNQTTDEAFADIFSSEANYDDQEKPNEDKDELPVPAKLEENSDAVIEEVETTKEKPKAEPDVDLNTEYELLERRLNDAKRWGHKKNSAYINAKKKITEFLTKLEDDSVINEEETKLALSFFDASDNAEDQIVEQQANPYSQLRQNLDKEFNIFKKYNKQEDIEEKYQAFFSFFALLSNEEQEKSMNYMINEAPELVLDNIMVTGAEIYDNLYRGSKKSGGIIPFVKSLHAKIDKLEKRNKELEADLDTTEGVIHNRSITSKVSNFATQKKPKSFAEIWQN